MADHEDYLPGESPAAHASTHEDGGTDEISLDDCDPEALLAIFNTAAALGTL